MAIGMDCLLSKPIKYDELEELIQLVASEDFSR